MKEIDAGSKNNEKNGHIHYLKSAIILKYIHVLHPTRSGCSAKSVHLRPTYLKRKGHKVNMPNLIIYFVETPLFEWCVVKCIYTNGQQKKHMFEGIGLRA